jgi:hypothetical protein
MKSLARELANVKADEDEPAHKRHDREALPQADGHSVCRLNPKARRQHGNVAVPLRLPQ